MRRSVSIVSVLLLLSPLLLSGQHSGKHGSTGIGAGSATQPEDADVATFKHAVAEQATDEQIGQFRRMVKSTEAARQQAHDFQKMGAAASYAEDMSHRATALQNSVDLALTDTRSFRRSFTDSQEATLKSLTKKLNKSDTAVGKSSRGISQQLEQPAPNAGRLSSAASNLEKELLTLQSDQNDLGKEMGISSR